MQVFTYHVRVYGSPALKRLISSGTGTQAHEQHVSTPSYSWGKESSMRQWKQQLVGACRSWRICHLNAKFLPSPSYFYKISWVELFYFSFTWLFWLISFLLPFEWLKDSKQIEGLVSWLVEVPGKFSSERDSCLFSRVELLMTRGLNGSMGLVATSQHSSQTKLHLDFIPGRRPSG